MKRLSQNICIGCGNNNRHSSLNFLSPSPLCSWGTSSFLFAQVKTSTRHDRRKCSFTCVQFFVAERRGDGLCPKRFKPKGGHNQHHQDCFTPSGAAAAAAAATASAFFTSLGPKFITSCQQHATEAANINCGLLLLLLLLSVEDDEKK